MRDQDTNNSDNRQQDDVIHIINQDRLRLSCDLHDHLLQPIVGALYHLQAYDNALNSNQTTPITQSDSAHFHQSEIVTVIGHLQQSLTIGQRLIDDLRHGFEEGETTSSSISQIVRAVVETRKVVLNKTKIELDDRSDMPLFFSAGKSAVLAGFVTEAIQNAQQHASANQIYIQLSKSEKGAVILKINDDGVGFDYDPDTDSHGLQGYRIRASLLDATFNLRSSSSGTSVQLQFSFKN